ncbi:MAG: tyrosine-type recombinase/integrase [Defluviitaleaceae bacterium]|nr:tyrosine-type recombinase/integrase [Defluviitaleaceae bacterium]
MYKSILGKVISDFISEKRIAGFKYTTEEMLLRRLDSIIYGDDIGDIALTQKHVESFLTYGHSESDKSVSNRYTIARQLARYMLAHDYNAYIAPSFPKKLQSSFVPHIYTQDELRRLFLAAEQCPVFTNCPNRRRVVSLLLRLLYGCGLRISEALNLQLRNVDAEQGILSILNSKNEISRYVPMSDELTTKCRDFINEVHSLSSPDDYFLPAPHYGKYSHRAIHTTFRMLLVKASIPYKGKKQGPRIHDIRHTFAVHCLKKWVQNGRELTNALPILSKYMGHASFAATQYYLRLTSDMFPHITQALEDKYGDIIPGIGGDCNEND